MFIHLNDLAKNELRTDKKKIRFFFTLKINFKIKNTEYKKKKGKFLQEKLHKY